MSHNALEGKRSNVFHVDPTQVRIVGLDTTDGPEHPLYDERVSMPLDPDMVEHARIHGIGTPIKVVKLAADLLPFVVTGRQRVRIARKLGIKVPAETVRYTDDAALLRLMVAENEHRVEDSVLIKARKAERYRKALIASGAEDVEALVAQAFRVSQATLTLWTKLLATPPEVQAAVEAGRMSMAAALDGDAPPPEEATPARRGRGPKRRKHGTRKGARPGKRDITAKLTACPDTKIGRAVAIALGWAVGVRNWSDVEKQLRA